MARDLTITISDKEEIISYEYHLVNKTVNVLVGVGSTDKDGNFVAQPNQTYKSYCIKDTDFDILLATKAGKPANTFRKDDLWEPIDILNSQEIAKLNKKV